MKTSFAYSISPLFELYILLIKCSINWKNPLSLLLMTSKLCTVETVLHT